MCIILVGKPEHITDKILLKAYNGNKDGFGLMYSKDNKIITEKFLPKKFKSVLKCFNKHSICLIKHIWLIFIGNLS